MAVAVACRNLVKRYDGRPPVEAVRGLNLEVLEGECFGLLGPNGAGKTTTIEIIEGLLPATAGEVEVLGHVWGGNDDAIRQRIGISFQETRLSEKLSVLETVTLFRSFYRQGLEPMEALARVSLEGKASAWVGKLSGGQRQRLAVACALVGDPQLLFLDEPTTGLDPQSRRQLWDIIRDFRAQARTVLITTHYMEEAERLCDRVAIVDAGQVIALGTPRELIAGLGGEHIIEFRVAWDGHAHEVVAQTPSLPNSTPVSTSTPTSTPTSAPAVGSSSSSSSNASAAPWDTLPSVMEVNLEGDLVRLSVREPHIALPALMQRIEELQGRLTSLSTRHASLEDVFVHLTGRHLEGAAA